MNPAWRDFAYRPSGVLLTLLLVVLLALGGHFCPMSAQAEPVHACCLDSTHPADHSVNPPTQDCHDGACVQMIGHDGATNPHGPPVSNGPDSLQPLLVATLWPPDWRGASPFSPSLPAAATGPPPPQRSSVLRL